MERIVQYFREEWLQREGGDREEYEKYFPVRSARLNRL
jgi:hypothetical protein